jgi:hypothetical protein
MNLLTEKHWTLSENTMRPWRIHWRSLTRMCWNWVQSFYHRPARHARGVMPTGHGGWLITFWTMIKRPYRPHGFVGDDSANSSWLLPIYVIDTCAWHFSTLENQDDFSFEDFVICPEDYDLAGLELMMDRTMNLTSISREVDENRGDYGGEE